MILPIKAFEKQEIDKRLNTIQFSYIPNITRRFLGSYMKINSSENANRANEKPTCDSTVDILINFCNYSYIYCILLPKFN